jgi:hypothetical protein
MIGRITKGGLVKTSKPLMVAATGVGLASGLGLSVGDGEGDGDGSGVGDAAVACSVKLAQGLGGTVAQSLWMPGGSVAKGLTLVVKFPFASAFDAPATLFGWSQ